MSERLPITATCGIDRLHERHLAALQVLASDPAIAARTRVPHPYPPDGARSFFAVVEQERQAGTAHVFAIENHGQFVGVCGFHGIRHGVAEFGFWVGRPHWRLGIGGHAAAAAVRVAFDYLQLQSLWAEALADNVASRRILAKVGFREVGQRQHTNANWPANVPLVRYQLERPATR
jgi:RimJ/RimL family protein N-acetyltransferase